MIVRLLLFAFLISSIVSCNSGTSKNELVKTDSISKKDTIKPFVKSVNCDSVVIDTSVYATNNDGFILNVLKNDLTSENLNKEFSDIKKHIVLSANKYSSGTSDTTVSYKVDCDSVSYIASKENSFPLHVSIQSERIKFDNGTIKVGISKQQFLIKLTLKDVASDVIKITETESANELIFVFVNQKLYKIVYNNLYVE